MARPPDVAKLAKRKDVAGLVAALGFDSDEGHPGGVTRQRIRREAANALGDLGDAGATNSLRTALEGSAERLERYAYILFRIAGDLGEEALRDWSFELDPPEQWRLDAKWKVNEALRATFKEANQEAFLHRVADGCRLIECTRAAGIAQARALLALGAESDVGRGFLDALRALGGNQAEEAEQLLGAPS